MIYGFIKSKRVVYLKNKNEEPKIIEFEPGEEATNYAKSQYNLYDEIYVMQVTMFDGKTPHYECVYDKTLIEKYRKGCESND